MTETQNATAILPSEANELNPTRLLPQTRRNGKIAQLSNEIRVQLNLRLFEGEAGRELVTWLNGLPEVQSILNSQFNGSQISEVNLTHWRQGGYLQWLTERECFGSALASPFHQPKADHREILSGPINPSILVAALTQSAFDPDHDLSEIRSAV